MKEAPIRTIDEYIAQFPKDIQQKLEEIRIAVRAAAPRAEETIKYAMPTFTLNGNLVHFAAYKGHIGFYPVPRSVDDFRKALSAYDGNKSTMKIPLDRPIPTTLIKKIVKYRMKKSAKGLAALQKHIS
jgi:uncharacterized protein YdhG (YjbR/CyaY superfamily)